MVSIKHTDDALIQRYLSGDSEAFGSLVKRHQERVFNFLLGMVRDRSVANDLFQDTWFNVIRALNNRRGSYEHTDRFVYWVLRIARNAALDHFRKQNRWRENGVDESYWDRLKDEAPTPDLKFSRAEELSALSAGIDRLPKVQREVVLLRQEGLKFREIAEITGVSINTALGRMRYALVNLRKQMKQVGHLELV